ncbi:MAG: hypothetical protein ABIT83_26130, partial [Massilia sp.]
MPRWIKGSLMLTLVFGACWGGAVWYWRATNRMPGGGDLLMLMLVLPLALLLALWLGRKLIAASALPAVAAAQTEAPAAAPPPPPAAPPLAIISAAVRAPHGASPEELAAAIADHKARTDLDPALVDADGFPVMTARHPEADDPVLRHDIDAWLAANGMAAVRFDEQQWRALTLATGVAADLAGDAAATLLPASGAPPLLHLMPILPAEWQIPQRQAAGLWLRHT